METVRKTGNRLSLPKQSASRRHIKSSEQLTYPEKFENTIRILKTNKKYTYSYVNLPPSIEISMNQLRNGIEDDIQTTLKGH